MAVPEFNNAWDETDPFSHEHLMGASKEDYEDDAKMYDDLAATQTDEQQAQQYRDRAAELRKLNNASNN